MSVCLQLDTITRYRTKVLDVLVTRTVLIALSAHLQDNLNEELMVSWNPLSEPWDP